jgi:hypothetical protein
LSISSVARIFGVIGEPAGSRELRQVKVFFVLVLVGLLKKPRAEA